MARVIALEAGCEVGIDMPEAPTAHRGGVMEDFERSDLMSCERARAVAATVQHRSTRIVPVTQIVYAYRAPNDPLPRRGTIEIELWDAGLDIWVSRFGTGLVRLPRDPHPWRGDLDPRHPHIGATFELMVDPSPPPSVKPPLT